jgi:hypothetical protein
MYLFYMLFFSTLPCDWLVALWAGMKMQSVLSGRAGKSKAMPFLTQPPNLDGSMPGDVGFDPLGISTFLDVKWLREAELKHGRICMLAWTGCLVQVSICVDVRMLALVCV